MLVTSITIPLSTTVKTGCTYKTREVTYMANLQYNREGYTVYSSIDIMCAKIYLHYNDTKLQ